MDWISTHWSLLDKICFSVCLDLVIFKNIFVYEFQITIGTGMLALPWIDFDLEQALFCLVFLYHVIEEGLERHCLVELHITKLALISFDLLSEALGFQVAELLVQVLVIVLLQNIL